ncbi:ComEC/Rec2 family competence protein [Botryobacter ruber]|uniref:ComEC/Rec2 family competence protein n=1 Tax=Botryobacter ruber TaxID=2171629 RepID=UPI000E0B1D6A|nr:ComEC/Rec2 family competence protein [Botryobacter ruber]
MWQWAPFPFVRVTLSFIGGILVYLYTGREFGYITELLAFFVLATLAAFAVSRKVKSYGTTAVAGLLALFTFAAAGFWVTQQRTALHHPHHFHNLKQTPAYYTGVVEDFVVQKPGHQATVLELQQVQVAGQWQPISGKVQLAVPHDSERSYELSYGDKLLIKGAPQAVPPPANPHQFDYRQYLSNKNIYFRHYLQPHQYEIIGKEPSNAFLNYSIRIRRKLEALLRAHVQERRELGISAALVLGVKDELDNAIRDVYAGTGTMHVLAVSGLHVGMIYLLLMLLFTGSRRTSRVGWVAAAVIIATLWGYAFVTGLSPSVLRAVSMFSLVTVGLTLRRQANIYNTVAAVAFALLFANPYYLLDVGFQLSFLAVLGIVYLQPRFNNLLTFTHWLPDYAWKLFTLALAAQLATLPLGLFYFHQFPVYFWLANLLVVVLASGALYSGVAALALFWIPYVGDGVFWVHEKNIWLMNEYNLWVGSLPQAVVNGIDISGHQALLLYVLLLLLIVFFALKQLLYLAVAVVAGAVLCLQQFLEVQQQKHQQSFTVYSLRGNTAFSFLQGQQATVFSNTGLTTQSPDYRFNLQPDLWHRGVQQPQFASLIAETPLAGVAQAILPDSNSLYVWQGLRVLVVSKPLQVQPKAPTAVDYVLLTQNVRITPEDLQGFSFKMLLLDASNSPWYLQKLKPQLTAAGIPFHDVGAEGAFVVELE